MPTHMNEVVRKLSLMSHLERREVNGIPVLRMGNDYRAEPLPNGQMSGWWRVGTMATILDSWTRKGK